MSAMTSLHAGNLIISTTPSYSKSLDGIMYLPISKWDAEDTGVTFSATASPDNGSISEWKWNFPNGAPQSSQDQNPGKVIFQNAYGNSCACTVGVKHTGSSNETCTLASSIVSTVNVNVIKPNLIMKTSGDWSANNPVYIPASEKIGQIYEYIGSYGRTYEGHPYEYKYTATPANGGIKSNDMAIYEYAYNNTDLYYKDGETQPTVMPLPEKQTTYKPGDNDCAATVTTPPDNPILYAIDSPSRDKDQVQEYMRRFKFKKCIHSVTLKSYPLYKDLGLQHLTDCTPAIATFTVTCISSTADGSGPYTWQL